ncbi:MAG: radical SAM protein [Spirochaetota bacterium]|nr:MAG: radical SAM protein [Spirochaetota bacterium]
MRFTFRSVLNKFIGLHSYDPKHSKTKLPGPLFIQVQTIDRCNGSCRMCPYVTIQRSGPPNCMDEELYTKIFTNLSQAETVNTVLLMLQNEPLLDNELEKRVEQARKILGNGTRILTVTNGTSLNLKRYEALLHAGLNSIEVSIDAFYEETYRSIRPGLDFSNVINNINTLLQKKDGSHIVVRFLKQRANENEEKQFKHYWKSRGVQICSFPIENRAGMIECFDQMRGSSPLLRKKYIRAVRDLVFPPCFFPFYALNILWDGRVILCCHDWRHIEIIGDLSAQSLQDVWNGDAINQYRNLLYNKRFEEIPICKDCSVVRRFSG